MFSKEKVRQKLAILFTAALVLLVTLDKTEVNAVEKKEMVLATATTGGTFYPMGVGMASLWSIKLAKGHGIQVSAITSAGSGENVNMLKNKEIHLAILQGLFGKMGWNGTGSYKGKPYKEMRMISMLWPNTEHFVILKKKVKTGTATDIKGLRFSLGRSGSGAERSCLTIMKGLGLSFNDIKPEHLGHFQGANAMKDGRISGANMPAGPPAGSVTDLFSAPGIDVTILEFTDKQLEQINKTTAYPGYRYVIEAKTYPGQTKAVRSIAQPIVLAVRADVDKDVVYLLTKTLFENPGYLKQVHKMAAFIKLDTAISGLPAPLHPGAYKYFKEKGLKIPNNLIPPA